MALNQKVLQISQEFKGWLNDTFAPKVHTHTGIGDLPAHNHDTVYSKLGHNHDSTYSKLGHGHTAYSLTSHDHDSTYAKLGHTHDGIGDLPAHNHDSVYSKLGHNHDTVYSKLGHGHTGFASTSHDHDDTYSKLGHVHNYAASDHNHDDVYSKLGHSHELIDMLPVGTVLWFGQDVELSNKWVVYEKLINRYPMGTDIPDAIGVALPAGVPEIYASFAGVGHIDSNTESVVTYARGAIRYAFDGDDKNNHVGVGLGVTLANEGAQDDVLSFRASNGQLKTDYVDLSDRELAGNQPEKYVSPDDSVYGKADTVRPDTVCLIPYIKIA